MVFRHFPLDSHPNAYRAARLAECGAAQNGFESVHRLLFRAIDLATLIPGDVARLAGLPDSTSFVRCAAQGGTIPQIEEDIAAGRELGIRGVPAFIVQGIKLGRAPDPAGLSDLILKHLEGSGTGSERS